jgi:hypothetical protein
MMIPMSIAFMPRFRPGAAWRYVQRDRDPTTVPYSGRKSFGETAPLRRRPTHRERAVLNRIGVGRWPDANGDR